MICIVDKIYDKLFKSLGKDFINAFFKFHGVNDTITCEKNADLTTILGELRADFIGCSIHGYDVNVEYQIDKPMPDDYYRFWKYLSIVHMKYGKGARGYVFTGAKVPNQEVIYTWYSGNTVKFTLISLVNTDADKILNKIKIKVKNNEVLTDEDILFLKAGYISDIDKLFERLKEMVELVNIIKTLDDYEIKVIKFFYDVISKFLLSDEEYRVIYEGLVMGTSFYQDKYNEGWENGREEEREEVVSNLIKEGQSNDFISRVTGLSINKIEEFRK